MKKDLAKIYLNEARLAESKTWDDVDNALNKLLKEHNARKKYPSTDKYAENIMPLIDNLKSVWDAHSVAAATLESMLDKTYGEIIDDDGDWYIREDREELLKEMEPKKTSCKVDKDDLERYIKEHYKPEEELEYI